MKEKSIEELVELQKEVDGYAFIFRRFLVSHSKTVFEKLYESSCNLLNRHGESETENKKVFRLKTESALLKICSKHIRQDIFPTGIEIEYREDGGRYYKVSLDLSPRTINPKELQEEIVKHSRLGAKVELDGIRIPLIIYNP